MINTAAGLSINKPFKPTCMMKSFHKNSFQQSLKQDKVSFGLLQEPEEPKSLFDTIMAFSKKDYLSIFFNSCSYEGCSPLKNNDIKPIIDEFADDLDRAPFFDEGSFEKHINDYTEKLQLRNKVLYSGLFPCNAKLSASATCRFYFDKNLCELAIRHIEEKDKYQILPEIAHEFCHALQFNTQDFFEIFNQYRKIEDFAEVSNAYKSVEKGISNYANGKLTTNCIKERKDIHFISENQQEKIVELCKARTESLLNRYIFENDRLEDKKLALETLKFYAHMDEEAYGIENELENKYLKEYGYKTPNNYSAYYHHLYQGMREGIESALKKL